MGEAEHADEWAFGDAGVVPGHDADQDDDGAEVEAGQQKESEARGAGNVFRGTRFAGGDGEHLYAAEGVDGPEDGEQRSDWTFGKESAVSGVLRGYAAAEQQSGAGQDEGHDGRELDHGEPELEASEGTHAAQVDQKKQR